ncbi:hypothetical protein Pla22_03420 [Rubripirellula amarantea]|uniref:GspL periplasmic domain protein n=1 Tax=Rubripirellula amarantea TaxID=2527999 RepID=A0A5C5WPP4_9BACT|nr:hypothetical protein [Rubripirellula amarantea]TWT52716.1 hypothetical protein Pla22_03420 [Rubripirellula amarantea]
MNKAKKDKSANRIASVCVVAHESHGWTLRYNDHSEVLPEDATADQIAQQVKESSIASGHANVPVVLAPSSDDCFFYCLCEDGDLDLRDRAALKFELEDHLPIDAEVMVVDFVDVVRDDRPAAACVAIAWKKWKAIADAIEDAGHTVNAIVPSTLLVTRWVELLDPSQGRRLLLITDNDRCDQVELYDGKIVDWKVMAFNEKTLQLQKSLRQIDESVEVRLLDEEGDHRAAIESIYPDVNVLSNSYHDIVTRGSAAYLRESSKDWIDLRRDELAPADSLRGVRTQLRWLGLAVASFLVAISVGGWWRAQRIESAIEDLRNQQVQSFRSSFPDTRVPSALLRRVRSEHARMLGSRGAKTSIDIPISAPFVLKRLLMALPDTVRFQIDRIEITNGEIDIELQSLSPVDAGRVAEALSQFGFAMKPPITNQSEDGTFNSQIRGNWLGPQRGPSNETSTSIQPKAQFVGSVSYMPTLSLAGSSQRRISS